MDSRTRQNYHPDCEFAVNQMVNMELHASLVYLSMAYYFQRDDIALKHVAAFLEEESLKKRGYAEKLLQHQNKRGGCILLHDIKKPEQDSWGTSLGALQSVLKLEKNMNQALLELHHLAVKKRDPQETLLRNYSWTSIAVSLSCANVLIVPCNLNKRICPSLLICKAH
ncbi:ferritin heavy chain A-like isoform X2 [Paroedura picta]|uniref:ferritin heavy chain A-like isoform X2 n=1 Tax=Paroedura picta TaxID=143630 RepID=UPI004056095E